jgi:hypothetical protein
VYGLLGYFLGSNLPLLHRIVDLLGVAGVVAAIGVALVAFVLWRRRRASRIGRRRNTGRESGTTARLWAGLDERREVLNTQLPTRALDGQAPLEAYPQATHSGRAYRPEWEEEMLDLERVYRYLAPGRWFRQARGSGIMQLAGYRYYLGRPWSGRTVEVPFSPATVSYLCCPEGTEIEIEALVLLAAQDRRLITEGQASVGQCLQIKHLFHHYATHRCS